MDKFEKMVLIEIHIFLKVKNRLIFSLNLIFTRRIKMQLTLAELCEKYNVSESTVLTRFNRT